MKIVKIMPEYGTGMLWQKKSKEDVFSYITPQDLKLGHVLITKLKDWDVLYQGTFNENYPPDSGFANKNERKKFEEKGLELWQDLIIELPSTIKVIYYSVIEEHLFEDIKELQNKILDL